VTQLTRSNFIAALREAVPGFNPDASDVADELTYLIANDLARYMCSCTGGPNPSRDLLMAASFLETAIVVGDEAVRDLADEALQTIAECPLVDEIRQTLGYNSLTWLDWGLKNWGRSGVVRPPVRLKVEQATNLKTGDKS
jgi:hypothetical protein